MAGTHGGRREGSGRKPNAEKYAAPISRFNDLAAAGLVQCFDNLATLADGGFERVEIKQVPAGLLTRKDVARDAGGEPILDDKLKPTIVEVQIFPELEADELVTVERKTTTLAPDYKANEFLVNRVMGGVRPEPEPDSELVDLKEAVELAAAAIAARKARGPASNEPPPEPAPTPPGADDDDESDE
jgi:hypothetical protein